MPSSRRVAIFVLLLAMLHVALCQGIAAKANATKKPDADPLEAVGAIVDLLMAIAWVFSGGPAQVFWRLCFLVVLTALLLVVAFVCDAFGYTVPKEKGRYQKGVEWGVRGVGVAAIAREFNQNAHKWK
jgi:hypothetical protein